MSELEKIVSRYFDKISTELNDMETRINSRFEKFEAEVKTEFTDVKFVQEQHTRILNTVANAVSLQGEKLVDLSQRVSTLERKVG